jgi:hypothetical protein
MDENKCCVCGAEVPAVENPGDSQDVITVVVNWGKEERQIGKTKTVCDNCVKVLNDRIGGDIANLPEKIFDSALKLIIEAGI